MTLHIVSTGAALAALQRDQPIRDAVLGLLRNANGRVVLHVVLDDIADRQGVRTVIWQLRKLGHDIVSIWGRGYFYRELP